MIYDNPEKPDLIWNLNGNKLLIVENGELVISLILKYLNHETFDSFLRRIK